jgi:hypothetical protein
LPREAKAETSNDLEPDPEPCLRVRAKRVKEARSDGSKASAKGEPDPDLSRFGGQGARDHGSNADGDDHGEIADTRVDWTGVIHALEVDGEIVEDDKVGAAEEEGEARVGPDEALPEDALGDHGGFVEPPLPCDEGGEDEDEADEEADDDAAAPRFGLAVLGG